MRTLELGSELALMDGTFAVTGTSGSLIRLKDLSNGQETTNHLADLTARLLDPPVWVSDALPQELTELTPDERAELDLITRHLEEMTTGARRDHERPRPQYDPELTSLNERVEAKVNELRAARIPASRASLLRKKALYLSGGTAALIDRRKNKKVAKFDRADQAVIEAIAAVSARQANKSTITQSYLHELVHAELIARYREDAPPMPSRATLYRYCQALNKGKYTGGKATTRRSAANRKNRTYRTSRRMLPGHEVQVDSTPLDILVWANGLEEPVRPMLSIMVDAATRSIIGATIRIDGTKGYDHALLLAQTLVPFRNRPDRTAHRALLSAGNASLKLLDEQTRLQLESARPYVYPRRLMTDNGKDYISAVFTSACRKYGIDVTTAAIRTPQDKAIVERTFQTINTLFTSRLPGYVGNHTVNRGHLVEEEDLLSIDELQELFDDWVVSIWQNRPHSELTDPFEPTITYSPNQAYNAAAVYAGTVAVPLTRDDFIDLLPSEGRTIGRAGISLNNRLYDSVDLHPLRGTYSNRARHGHTWEVKYNPYDAMHIWVRGTDGNWIEASWKDIASIDMPHFADISREARAQRRTEYRAHRRDNIAQNSAALAGTPMPVGTAPVGPEPTQDYNYTPGELDTPVEGFPLINDNEEY